MNTRNKIDELFSEAMTGYQVEPSIGLWRRIERRFFPPSKFRPSGLITSIFLLTVAGLMPWILIPANDQSEKEPTIPSVNIHEGKIREGYLIESASPEQVHKNNKNGADLPERTFSVKPTVYLESPVDPAGDPSDQFLASVSDPDDDPAIFPILSANQQEYNKSLQYEDAVASFTAEKSLNHMHSFGPGLMDPENINYEISTVPYVSLTSTFSPNYENDYVRKAELSAGVNFNPSIVFYNPNPYNQMLGAEAVVHYKISAFSIMSGVGFSRMQDIGSYQINYKTNDSVGFYLRVVSFTVDPRNPGHINYVFEEEPIYDSVPHYSIEDKTNYYSYIDIPLSFGYSVLQRSRVTLTVSVGVKFSVLVDKQEPTVDFRISNAELVDIEQQVPSRMNTNWRFTAGIDFGYLLTQKFSLHLEPVFEKYISSVYAEQPGYKPKKPYVTGIKVGIRYNF
jgi:hypothetical protein